MRHGIVGPRATDDHPAMTPIEPIALRTFVYDQILTGGPVPSSADIGAHFGVSAADARRALAELRIGKTVLVEEGSGEIWMAGPFSARETGYRVEHDGHSWWANCAWDMFGVAHLVQAPVTVETHCCDCGTPMSLRCDPSCPPPNDAGVIHFLVPARHWYDDIGFT